VIETQSLPLGRTARPATRRCSLLPDEKRVSGPNYEVEACPWSLLPNSGRPTEREYVSHSPGGI
jgi:hypothetical protein